MRNDQVNNDTVMPATNLESEAIENVTDPLSAIIHLTSVHLKRAFWFLESIKVFIGPNQSDEEIRKSKAVVMEILRSQIVLAHAILEDGLREILRIKLRREMLPEVLATIPLTGISQGGQPKKFGLEDLARHRGKTVDELLQESVDDYLDGSSFTSSQNIARMLEKSGIDTLELKKYFPTLDQMIARRHQIVHRADRIGDLGKWRISSVAPNDVITWLMTILLFMNDVALLAYPPEERIKLQEELDRDENLKEVLKTMKVHLGKTTELNTGELLAKLQN